ncbi:hypothetical protein DS884_04635 [Tenacibaculum sp. E3R01]|uniref:helix-turn-helix domain-containing protein n=1 Tax=Tenacibaculum sp. E3R01 TaxID=2267227 RepID=UPI000DE8A1D1|nr:helix-turn-helix transcriptional regulator [Tenacibaculum sp. E3R01]RBW60324.1 hypothetical protein DS884_04635 [Tenacibaculum sp. E3R01]
MTKIGKRIKETRIKKGLSQETLAEYAKINLRTVQRIENNETTPRDKTLKLILNALDIEIIKQEKNVFNKDLIIFSFLTLTIIIGSILGWYEFISNYGINYKTKGPQIITVNGWRGHLSINKFNFKFYNWLVSISALSIGLILISDSLGIIKKKKRYILSQLTFIFYYLFILIVLTEEFSKNSKYFVFKPGLFIVIISTILLTIHYLKKVDN